MTKSNNKNLHKAKDAKKDEFYTQMGDIEKEMLHYRPHFKGKTIFCNCDDPMESNFFKFFSLNFEFFGLKKLITACYGHNGEKGKYLIYEGDKNGNLVPDMDEIEVVAFEGDGDFRSEESIALLKESDIVITNPPFSLFREFVAQLDDYGKNFIIIGSQNAITYKVCFNMIKKNKMWLGSNLVKKFRIPDDIEHKSVKVEDGVTYAIFGNICWFTNLNYPKRHEDLILFRKYTPEEYPKYDNYDAINVNKTCDIPMDYEGVMGVPITFLDKYNPEQFEIETLGIGEHNFTPTKKYEKFRDPFTKKYITDKRDFILYIRTPNGKYLTSEGYRVDKIYSRILIKNKKVVK